MNNLIDEIKSLELQEIQEINGISKQEHDFFKRFMFIEIINSPSILYYIYDLERETIYKYTTEIKFQKVVMSYINEEKYFIGSMPLLRALKQNYQHMSISDRAFVSYYLNLTNKIIKVDNVLFKPTEDKIFEDKRNKTCLNEYIPTKYLRKAFNNKNIDESKFPNIKELILHLCDNDEGAYKYVLKVLANSIINPTFKRHGYLLFFGEQGSGKGTFFETILRPIFEEYLISEEKAGVQSNFNSLTYKCLWFIVEEISDVDGDKYKSNFGDKVKRETGNLYMNLECKGKDKITVRDYRNWILTTNKFKTGLNLDVDDRRATVLGRSKTLGGSHEKAARLGAYYRKVIPDELEDFVSYLKNLEFDISEINIPYQTEAKELITNSELNNTQLFIKYIKTFKDTDLTTISNKLNNNNNLTDDVKFKIYSNNKNYYISCNSLYDLYKRFCENNGKRFSAKPAFYTELEGTLKISKSEKRMTFVKESKINTYNFNDFIDIFKLNFDKEKYNIIYQRCKK